MSDSLTETATGGRFNRPTSSSYLKLCCYERTGGSHPLYYSYGAYSLGFSCSCTSLHCPSRSLCQHYAGQPAAGHRLRPRNWEDFLNPLLQRHQAPEDGGWVFVLRLMSRISWLHSWSNGRKTTRATLDYIITGHVLECVHDMCHCTRDGVFHCAGSARHDEWTFKGTTVSHECAEFSFWACLRVLTFTLGECSHSHCRCVYDTRFSHVILLRKNSPEHRHPVPFLAVGNSNKDRTGGLWSLSTLMCAI